jgi:hypothetical protein
MPSLLRNVSSDNGQMIPVLRVGGFTIRGDIQHLASCPYQAAIGAV